MDTLVGRIRPISIFPNKHIDCLACGKQNDLRNEVCASCGQPLRVLAFNAPSSQSPNPQWKVDMEWNLVLANLALGESQGLIGQGERDEITDLIQRGRQVLKADSEAIAAPLIQQFGLLTQKYGLLIEIGLARRLVPNPIVTRLVGHHNVDQLRLGLRQVDKTKDPGDVQKIIEEMTNLLPLIEQMVNAIIAHDTGY